MKSIILIYYYYFVWEFSAKINCVNIQVGWNIFIKFKYKMGPNTLCAVKWNVREPSTNFWVASSRRRQTGTNFAQRLWGPLWLVQITYSLFPHFILSYGSHIVYNTNQYSLTRKMKILRIFGLIVFHFK